VLEEQPFRLWFFPNLTHAQALVEIAGGTFVRPHRASAERWARGLDGFGKRRNYELIRLVRKPILLDAVFSEVFARLDPFPIR
jgi:hypothetical protein